jgi:hypothetical protein
MFMYNGGCVIDIEVLLQDQKGLKQALKGGEAGSFSKIHSWPLRASMRVLVFKEYLSRHIDS